MNNYIYLNNNIYTMNNLKYENNVNEKIEIYNKLPNKEIIKKFQDDLLLLKKIINKILNIKNSTNIILNLNEEKIYELLYYNIANIYKKTNKKKPHFIVSSTENKYIIKICQILLKNNIISLTIIKPNILGIISLNNIKKNIKSNTCLIIINYSNNILGYINEISDIALLCKNNNVLFHCDISHIFLEKKQLTIENIDIITYSYSKFLNKTINIIIKNDKISYLNKENLISNFINYENKINKNNIKNLLFITSLIIDKYQYINILEKKNITLKQLFLNKIKEYIPIILYNDYLNIKVLSKLNNINLIIFNYPNTISNTIICCVYINNSNFSNKLFINTMDQYGIKLILPFNNHNLDYLKNDKKLYNGLISLKFNENVKTSDINLIIKAFLKSIQHQYNNLFNNIIENTNKNKSSIKSINKIKKRVRFTNPEYMILTKKKNLPKNINKNIKSILVKY